MAEKDLFSRLKRLFSTNTIVRNIGGKKLKIVDTGQLQSNVQTNLVDRYSKNCILICNNMDIMTNYINNNLD